MSKRLITTGLQYIAFLGIGLLFAWLSLRELDQEKWTQMKASIQRAELWLIIPVSLLLVISHYLRGLRWKLLIDPMGHEVKPMNTFLTVLIGYLDQRMTESGSGWVRGATCYGGGDCPERFAPL